MLLDIDVMMDQQSGGNGGAFNSYGFASGYKLVDGVISPSPDGELDEGVFENQNYANVPLVVQESDLPESCGSVNGWKPHGEDFPTWSDHGLVGSVKLDDSSEDPNYGKVPMTTLDSNLVGLMPSSCSRSETDLIEDFDFSDVALKYISQMLMEENIEEKTCMFQESAALQAAEKSLYEVIGEQYPHTLDEGLVSHVEHNHESPSEDCAHRCNTQESVSINSCGSAPCWNCESLEQQFAAGPSQSISLSSVSSSSSGNGTGGEAYVESPMSTLTLAEIFSDSDSLMQFQKGVEEARKFLPDQKNLFADFGGGGVSSAEPTGDAKNFISKTEKMDGKSHLSGQSRGKKNPHPKDVCLDEGRSHKQSAVYSGRVVSSEMFDMVLLSCSAGGEAALREELQQVQLNERAKPRDGGKGRGKRRGRKKHVIDLRTLLTLCAQSVVADDRRTATDLLKQIRQHSSDMGDGMQRMAHYFANGLEARLAGSGTQIYNGYMSKPTSAADILKAYHLFLAVSPFRKVSNFFSNKTIMKVAENAKRLHIIDFGIYYGFQWPCLIQRLSTRIGGPPELRITGIDLPQPGFRPAERVEETGERLRKYAQTFNVQFEFNAIAQRWDTIGVEDLKIREDEVLVVNCMYRLRNLLDETVVVESPRDIVLNLIRNLNPKVFVLGAVNGAYSAPFFITRFREALFHFSTIYDMCEATVPRENPERRLVEKEIFGWEAMNAIACEGAERIERPETYKQCQVRILRAGFRQLPLDEEIVETAKSRVRSYYHKDFAIDVDGRWLLQGWKGRLLYALSTWAPAKLNIFNTGTTVKD